MAKSTDQKELTVVDVRVYDVSLLPPRYFLHDAVIETLERVIRSEVVVNGKPVPAGVRTVIGSPLSLPLGLSVKKAANSHRRLIVVLFFALVTVFAFILLIKLMEVF